jgi:thioesterase domain-containing protein
MPPTAEAWAAFCLERLADIPHHGPYIVGGWSFGGVVALELARTLQARGADVRRVLLIDTWMPHHRAVRRGFFGHLILHLNRMIELDRVARRHYVRKRVRKKIAQLRGQRRTAHQTLRERDAYGVDHIITNRGTEMSLLQRAVWVAHYKYRGARTSLPVSLYCSAGSRDTKNDISLGWLPSLRGDFESLAIPGEHFTIFDAPHVATLAARIGQTVASCAPARRPGRSFVHRV